MSLLFENYNAGKLQLKNHLVMPPMATGKAMAGDIVSDDLISYYEERAKHAKIGLIITEHSYIHVQGKASKGQVSLASDDTIAGFKKLTDTIHKYDVKVVAQLNHAGSATSSTVTGVPVIGPSPIMHPRKNESMPSEMTVEQIHQATSWFAEAALRAKKAGFDGVEIHSAHGYLLNQFYSPMTNQRTDEYGPQSIESRTKFHQEVLKAVREAVGEDFTIIIRIGGTDYSETGSTVEDCVEACKFFEQYGADIIDITGGMKGYVRPAHNEPGYFKDMSIPVKAAVSIPVILTGGVTTIEQAENLINENACDLVGVGRAIFKDAHWAD